MFYQTVLVFQMDSWSAETVVSVPAKKVEGWALPEMPGKECESQYIDLYGVISQRRGLEGGGGGALNKASYWEAPPRGLTPYPFI